MIVSRFENVVSPKGRRVQTSFGAFVDELDELGRGAFRGEREHPGYVLAALRGDVRAGANVEHVSAIAVDYDAGQTSIIDALSFWSRARAYLHTTRRHRPEAPRFRVLAETDRPMLPEELAAFWRYVVPHLADAGQVTDTSTRDPARFWYAPGRADLTEPFVSYRISGKALPVDKILALAPPAPTRPEPRPIATATAYAHAALERAAAAVRGTSAGGRNDLLVRESFAIGGLVGAGALSGRDAFAILVAAAIDAGLPEREARATCDRGLRAGAEKPRVLPERGAA